MQPRGISTHVAATKKVTKISSNDHRLRVYRPSEGQEQGNPDVTEAMTCDVAVEFE